MNVREEYPVRRTKSTTFSDAKMMTSAPPAG